MKIVLDATALRALIEADPGFEVEIKRAVIGQVVKTWSVRAVEKLLGGAREGIEAQARKAARETLSEVVEGGDRWFGPRGGLTEYARDAISTDAKARVREAFNETYEGAIAEAVEAAVSRPLRSGKTLTEVMMQRIENRVGMHFDKAVDEEVKRRLGVILSGARELAESMQ